jgi:hypothetical protein
MCIENPDGAFDDQAVQIMRANDVTKRFAQTMKEIENQTLLDLNGFIRTLETANAPALPLIRQ